MVLLVVLRSKKIYLAENTLDKTQIKQKYYNATPLITASRTPACLLTTASRVQTLTVLPSTRL